MATMTAATILCCLVLGSAAIEAANKGSGQFVLEPQDAVVPPGGRVQIDCELVDENVCAWRIDGTDLGVDHFYNVEPPAKVRPLFPDHERVCSILISDIDWRYDGYWTCWPLGDYSHYSSRAARITVSGTPVTTEEPTPEPPTSPAPEPSTTPAPEPSTTPAPEPTTTPPAPDTTTPPAPDTTTPPAPDTTTPYWPTTTHGPSPDFVCPQPFGLFADPKDDSYFYFCEEGDAIHLQCEYPQKWDDYKKTCD